MKKILFSAFLSFFLVSGLALAQQKKQFFDSPFGVGGGVTPAWMLPDFSGLNEVVAPIGTPELPKGGFFAMGGTGFVYLGFIPNLRIGGMGLGGSTSVRKTIGGFTNQVEYLSSFGGFTAEYSLPFVRSFGVSLGVIIGGGQTEINISRHAATAYLWDDIWKNIADPSVKTDSYTRSLRRQYFNIVPTVNVDFPVYRFFSVRVGAGYSIPFGDKWTMDNEIEVANVPEKTGSGGLYISTGLLFGFFAY